MNDRDTSGSSNRFDGTARQLVQTRDVYGGVHQHQHQHKRADPPPVPRQLPMRKPGFVARRAELADLRRSARTGRSAVPVVRVISGSPGVGKTALALHAAHSLAAGFPDGQLYVDMCGYSPDEKALDAATVLPRLLHALGVSPKRVPADLQMQSALLRSVVAGRRVMLLLDNVNDVDQVRPLILSGAHRWTVVTSRDTLEGLVADGAKPLRLRPLDDDSSRKLLGRKAGRATIEEDPTAVDAIVKYCGGLPLALTIVAAKMVVEATYRPRQVLDAIDGGGDTEEFMDTGDHRTSLESVFSWSLDTLTAEAQDVFRAFGVVHTADLSVATASAVAHEPPSVTRRALVELRRANIVEQIAADRFRCHHLLRAFAAKVAARTWSPDGCRERFHGFLHRAAVTAYAAERQIYPLRDDLPPAMRADLADEALVEPDRAVKWLEDEHENLVAVIDQAWEEGHLRELWQLSWSMTTFLDRRGYWADYERTQRLGLRAAREINEPIPVSMSCRLLATALARLERHSEVAELLDEALRHANAAGDLDGAARTYFALAHAHYADNDVGAALSAVQHAYEAYTATGNEVGAARSLSFVAWFRAHRDGASVQALAEIDEALERLFRLDHDREIAHARHHRGFILDGLDRRSEAIADFRDAAARFADLNDAFFRARSLVSLGQAHRDRGDREPAAEAWRDAYRLLEPYGGARLDLVRQNLEALDGPGYPAG